MGGTAGGDNRAPSGSRPVALQRLDGVVRVAAATTMTRTSAVVGARDQTSDRPPRTDRARPSESSSRRDGPVRIRGDTFVVIDPRQFRWRTVPHQHQSQRGWCHLRTSRVPIAPGATATRLGPAVVRPRLRIPREGGRSASVARCSSRTESGFRQGHNNSWVGVERTKGWAGARCCSTG